MAESKASDGSGIMELRNFKFIDLMPSSINSDPKIRAAAEVLDNLYSDMQERTKSLLIYSRIDELDEATIDDLAWQFNLNFFDGWALTASLDEKRDLIKFAFQQKMYKGTRYSIERTSELLKVPIEIIEWWQDYGGVHELEPYEFVAIVDTSKFGLQEGFYEDVLRLIVNLKNVRSHLKRITTLLNVRFSVFTGVSLITAEFGIVYPQFVKRIVNNAKLFFGVGTYGYGSGQVLGIGNPPTPPRPDPDDDDIDMLGSFATGDYVLPEQCNSLCVTFENFATGDYVLPEQYNSLCVTFENFATGVIKFID